MVLNIVICDDIVTEAETTAAFVQRYYQQRNLPLPQITLVQTGQQLRAQQAMDLVFLDIELVPLWYLYPVILYMLPMHTPSTLRNFL